MNSEMLPSKEPKQGRVYMRVVQGVGLTAKPSNPTPTVRRHSPCADPSVIMVALDGGAQPLPLKGRDILMFLLF
jgi:hypothetical protein